MPKKNLGLFPCCYWFTGLSGAGKSTLSTALARALSDQEIACYVLDGDELRQGLNQDLGFSREDRAENVRRLGEVARLMVDAGLVVLVAAIAPYRRDRDCVRQLFPAGRYFEVFVDADLTTCIDRDPKGLYRKAERGEILQLTGLGAPYERPLTPDLSVSTSTRSVASCCEQILRHHLQLR
jgi:adenylylsulfate kinase